MESSFHTSQGTYVITDEKGRVVQLSALQAYDLLIWLDEQKAKIHRTVHSEAPDEQEETYTPTPADQALYVSLLTGQVCMAIQQEYTNQMIVGLDTYNHLYAVARKADVAVRRLGDILEGKE